MYVKLSLLLAAVVIVLGMTSAVPVPSPEEKKVSYEGYKVFHVTPFTKEHLAVLAELEEKSTQLGISFWEESRTIGKSADVMVPPYFVDIANDLAKQGFQVEEYISNVQKLIDNERVATPGAKLSFTAYHRYPVIQEFLHDQAAAFPTIARVISIGKTFEGRDMSAIIINKSANKPVIFVEAQIHAREWIAGAVATYLINALLHSTDPVIAKWSEDYEWHVLPVTNPDGLEFTHTNDRLWRKTRSVRNTTTCRGVDGNRNWSYKWGTGGSSTDPCSITYMGPTPFSEPETKALAEYITGINERLVFYLDLHSYSQIILFPYGVVHPYPEKELYLEIGRRAADALKVKFGTEYTVGTVIDDLYLMSGGSHDWVKGTYNTTLVTMYELRDKGAFGFLLPPSQIINSGIEFLDSLKSLVVDLTQMLTPNA
jgi:hypothetical protein